jgi:hypothetical protein
VLILGGDAGEAPTVDNGQGVLWAAPTAYVFDPAATSITNVGSPLVSRWAFATVRLADARILITGGMPRAIGSAPLGDDVPLADAEIFDPVTGTFTRTGPMRWPRAGHSMALLADGTVLVAGGRPEMEIFDPATGTFSAAGSAGDLVGGRLVRLPDRQVLLVDGYCSEVPRSGRPEKNPNGPSGPDGNEEPVQVYRFDAATRSLESMPRLPHCTDTSTPLPDGRLFVTGFSWAGIYDPATGATQVTEPPAEGRYKKILLLADGRVLKVSTTMELFR